MSAGMISVSKNEMSCVFLLTKSVWAGLDVVA